MLDKVEFSDLYKFKTSIGLIIIAIGFVLPWLLLKQGDELLISYEDYYNLIPESRKLADNKISFNLTLLNFLPVISIFLIIFGAFLTGWGYKKWHAKQKIADETERINFDNLKAGVKKQKPSQIQEEAENQIDEEIKGQTNPENENQNRSNEKNEDVVPKISDNKILSKNLIDMERLFLDKINSFNSFNYQVNHKVLIGEKYKVDFLLNSYNPSKYRDLLIEIKYFQNNLSMKLVRDSYNSAHKSYEHYTTTTKRRCRLIFIVVYKHDIADTNEINRFIQAMEEFKEETKLSIRTIFTITELEAETFDINLILK